MSSNPIILLLIALKSRQNQWTHLDSWTKEDIFRLKVYLISKTTKDTTDYGHTKAKYLILRGSNSNSNPNPKLIFWQGTYCTNIGADNLAENTTNAPEFICPICLHKAESSGFQWKKASLGIRSSRNIETLKSVSNIGFLIKIQFVAKIFSNTNYKLFLGKTKRQRNVFRLA